MEVEVLLGTIQLFSFPFAPIGYMSCEGQILQIIQNQALFTLITNSFGGDGRSTFALPNLNGASPEPLMKYYIATMGVYPSRE
jgi:microcystin-dependent protein